MRLPLTVIVAACVASPVAASPIQIQSGFVSMSGPLIGPAAFSLTADGFLADAAGSVQDTGLYSTCFPCAPSQAAFSLGGTIVPGSGFSGAATFQGTTYTLGFMGDAAFSLTLTGPPILLPPPGPASMVVTGPFSMSGFFAVPPSGPSDLIGSGMVHATLVTNTNLNSWEFQSAVWEFAEPVPEPATLLMLAAGLAGLARARRGRDR